MRRFWRYALITAGVLAFCASVAVSLQTLVREANLVRESLRSGNWIAAQLELEFVRFLGALDRYSLAAPDLTQEDLVERFEILWSRIGLVHHGQESEPLRTAPGFLPLTQSLLETLRWVEPRLDGLQAGDRSGYQEIAARLLPFQDAVHGAVRRLMVESDVLFARKRLELVYLQLVGSLVGVLATGGLLVLLLVREVRRNERLAASERAAKDRADAASQAKSQFLANTSHELRTPLNAIIGFSEIMASGMFGPLSVPRYESYVRDIHASATHLLDVINTLLEMAKIEAGVVELSEEEVEPAELIESSLRFLRQRILGKNITLTVEIAPGLPRVRADERLLKQSLLNLLSNAAKFTAPGGRIAVAARIDTERRLVIQVQDDGIGMSPDGVRIALQPFGQVDDGHERRYEGTGLGLPLAKAFVEMHGGGFDIASALGRGTTVKITLPAHRTIAKAAKLPAAGRPVPASAPLPPGEPGRRHALG